MHLGYFDIAIPKGRENVADQELAKQVIGMFDKNKDGQLARDEVDPDKRPLFDKIDANQDGIVTEEELIPRIPELRRLLRL